MFQYLFGFDSYLPQEVDYMFNLNHLFLILGIVAFITTLTLVFKNRSEKTQKIMLATVAILMIVLEIGRIVWKLLNHVHDNGTIAGFDWAWNISFQLCAIMTWFVSINLLIGVFGKNKKWNQISYSIMVGVALICGSLTFLYPDLIDTGRSLLHFRNFQTVLDHALLIFVPVFLLATNKVTLSFQKIYIPFLALAGSAAIAMPMSFLTDHNFMFMKECSLFADLGLNIPFPYHLLVLGVIFFALQALVYGSVVLSYKLKEHCKNRKN